MTRFKFNLIPLSPASLSDYFQIEQHLEYVVHLTLYSKRSRITLLCLKDRVVAVTGVNANSLTL